MTDYRLLAKAVFEEQNIIRTNPLSYIEYLEFHIKHLKDEILSLPDEDPIKLIEGKSAYDEAIKFLKSVNAIDPLNQSEFLNLAAIDHAQELGQNGASSHESIDGKNLVDRIDKYGVWDGLLSENIDFGSNNAKDIIIFMLVDDGVKDRTHRKNLFNSEYKYCGIGCSEHQTLKHVTVCDYCTNIRDESEENPNIVTTSINVLPSKKKPGKNTYQETDIDAPDNTKSVKIITITKTIKGKTTTKIKKIYTLDDNTKREIEVDK